MLKPRAVQGGPATFRRTGMHNERRNRYRRPPSPFLPLLFWHANYFFFSFLPFHPFASAVRFFFIFNVIIIIINVIIIISGWAAATAARRGEATTLEGGVGLICWIAERKGGRLEEEGERAEASDRGETEREIGRVYRHASSLPRSRESKGHRGVRYLFAALPMLAA